MAIAVFVLLLIFLVWCWKDAQKPAKFPPGPPWSPFLGNIPLLMRLKKVYKFHHHIWQHLSKLYGDVVGLRIGKDRVVVISGKTIRKFYSLSEFDGRPDGFFFRIRSFDKRLGLVFVDEGFWECQRQFVMKTLKQLGFGKISMAQSIEFEVKDLMEHLKATKADTGKEIEEMENIFSISVLNVMWTLMAGYRYELEDENMKNLVRYIQESFRVIDMSGGILNQFPLVRHILPKLSGFQPLVDTLIPQWKFLADTIEHISCNIDWNATEEPKSLIESYLREMNKENKNESFTEDQLLCLCLDLFEAGMETTSNSLAFGLIYMLHNPVVAENVRKELENVIGLGNFPVLSDRPRLRYTEAVVCEILRFSTVAPLAIVHRALKNVQMGELIIPKNTLALVSIHSLHMDEKYWKDPHVFRPERFLDADYNIVNHDFHFLPFGHGRRRCMGENVAKSSLFLFFASFLHAFEFSTSNIPPTEGLDGISISPQPFRLSIKSRF